MKAEMRLTNSERWKVDGEVVKGLAEVEKKKKKKTYVSQKARGSQPLEAPMPGKTE